MPISDLMYPYHATEEHNWYSIVMRGLVLGGLSEERNEILFSSADHSHPMAKK